MRECGVGKKRTKALCGLVGPRGRTKHKPHPHFLLWSKSENLCGHF